MAAPLLYQAPANAACIGGISICSTFDVGSLSQPTAVSLAALTPNTVDVTTLPAYPGPNGAANFTHATAVFSIANFGASTPFTITNVKITAGDGITSTLNLGSSLLINGNGTFNLAGANVGYAALGTPVQTVDWSNSRISFDIPGNFAAAGIQISALVNYANTGTAGDGVNANSGLFTTTGVATPVPSPLPILGAAAAFGYSRKIRQRIKSVV